MLPNKIYHILNHANGEENLFREKQNYDYFFKKVNQYILPIAEIYAWCLLPNHFHFLLKIKSEVNLQQLNENFLKFSQEEKEKYISKQFANFFSSYSQSFNKFYSRSGSLFQKNFKRIAVENRIYFKNLIVYVHTNPHKHGFSAPYFVYSYSSYQLFRQRHNELVISLFGSEEDYVEAHKIAVTKYEKDHQLPEALLLE